MPEEIRDFDDLAVAFGGLPQLAKAAGVKRQATTNWRARGAIPAARWPVLIDAATRRGISLDYNILRTLKVERRRHYAG